jgi:hypothetical protein
MQDSGCEIMDRSNVSHTASCILHLKSRTQCVWFTDLLLSDAAERFWNGISFPKAGLYSPHWSHAWAIGRQGELSTTVSEAA